MKKYNYIIILLALIGTFFTSSCSDEFLDKPPRGRYGYSDLQSSTGIEGLLVGAYGALDGIPVQGSEWHGSVHAWVFGDIVSDDSYKGTDAGDQPEQTFLERYVWLPLNNHVRGKWGAVYNGVARTNKVIQALNQFQESGNSTISEERATQILAEARFLRGVYHFEAKRMWNNIPYYDEQIYDSTDPNSVKISNTEDVWPKIAADFQAAIDVLPETQADKGRPTSYAAMAMLARCYMYQGFDVTNGTARMDMLAQAKPLLDEVINSGMYALVDQYNKNWSADPENRNNIESVFEVQYSVTAAADGGGGAGLDLAWPYNSGPGGCCGFYQPSQNLVNAHKTLNGLPLLDNFNDVDVTSDEGINSNEPFTPYQDPLDPRLDWSVGRRGIPYLDWADEHPGRDWVRDQAYAGPYSPKKHIPEKRNTGVSGNLKRSANDYRMLRLAHVLLWRAEIAVEENDLATALNLVNQVRARAANPAGMVQKPDGSGPAANYVVNAYPAFPDQIYARKAVRFEERLEFAMEGTRFFDLVRWGTAAETLNSYLTKERIKRTYLNGAQFIKGTHEYYPIPFQEIVNTLVDGKATLTQNDGYN